MICPKCRAEYREEFKVCADCGVDLIVPPSIFAAEIYSRKKNEVGEVTVNNRKMRCPVCEGTDFRTDHVLLHGATYLKDGRRATNQICIHCGYLFWFLKE